MTIRPIATVRQYVRSGNDGGLAVDSLIFRINSFAQEVLLYFASYGIPPFLCSDSQRKLNRNEFRP